MTFLTESLTFTSSITSAFIRQAEFFSREQKGSQKARQIYLNTLAVQAVHFYCECMGVETELAASDSWNATMRSLTDTADLLIKGKGRLECRPVLPGEEICSVPPDAQIDRIGYVVVEIEEEKRQAKLLGFKPTAPAGVLPVKQLSSLEDLIDAIVDDAPALVLSPAQASSRSMLVQLQQWFQDVFDELWQNPDLVLATSYRGANTTGEPVLQPFRKRVKLLTIGEQEVALIVQITQNHPTERDILLKVCPAGGNTLPQGLVMQLLDDSEAVVMETQAERSDNFRALNFQIDTEESFSVKISLENKSVTEHFLS